MHSNNKKDTKIWDIKEKYNTIILLICITGPALPYAHNLIILFLFITGPTLPYALRYSAMAEFPDGRGVLLFGGDSSENGYEDRILELHVGSNSWNILNITLKYRRGTHAVIPLQWINTI